METDEKTIYAPASETSTRVIALHQKRGESYRVHACVMVTSQAIGAGADKYLLQSHMISQ